MDHFVKLDRLPDGYEFPPDLRDRILFDPQARRLVFHGYMSKAEFDRLCEQTKDWGFRRALEELFRLSVAEVKPPPAKPRGLLGVITRFFASR
jgi:hypothetical protein